MLIDTHAHLQWQSFNEDREMVLNRARERNVQRIINVGFDFEASLAGIKFAEKDSGLYATVGIHPHNANQLDQALLDNLRELATHKKVVGIGEVGLDYYRTLSPKNAQKKAFEAQLSIARDLDLPVVIHNRQAHKDILETLSKFKGEVNGVMHCFSGDKEIAEQYINLGFYISFAGTLTYPNAFRLCEAAKRIELHKILIETDCPWLAPQKKRGRRNEPSFIQFTAERLASLRGISLEVLAEITTENAEAIFKFS